jgi:hypothetical protein
MSGSHRNYFSVHLLWTAQTLSKRAGEMEAAPSYRQGHGPGLDMEHQSFVLSSIIASAAFLEAAVNEVFQDACDRRRPVGLLTPLDEETIHAMAMAWIATDGGARVRALDKWQLLLECAGKERLASGELPYQDAQYVVQLRNALVHFRPENVPFDSAHAWERRLRGKFPDNQIADGLSDAWWPIHCLGYGCAKWASDAVVLFADRVAAELGMRFAYRIYTDLDGLGRAPTLPQPQSS